MSKRKVLIEEAKSDLIVQHNHLIEARYYLTLQEKRLMCWLSSQVKQTDEDFKEHELSIKEFSSLIGIKGDHLYKTLNVVTHKLMQKVITIKSLKKKGFTKASLLGGVEYYDDQGIIKLSFHPYLKPYMLQLKERFTQISLGDVIGFKSVHAIRIYELLKQYESIGKREIFLSDLRDYCGITIDQYKKFNNLKKDILERSKKEINLRTDLLIDYKEIKNSRKIIAIEWVIQKKTKTEKFQDEKAKIIKKDLRSQNALIEKIMEYGFSRLMAKKFLRQDSEEIIQNALKSVDLQVERGNVKNTKAMLQTAIKDHWNPQIYKSKKNPL